MSRRWQRGMTLIEVLISVSLLSLLSVGMLFALRAGLSAMESAGRRVALNRRAMGAQRILAEQVAGFLPAKARCGASEVSEGVAPTALFSGQEGVMRFATRYSLSGASRGMPMIVELFVAPGEGGKGVRLLVNERPYNGPAGAGFLCSPPMPDPALGLALPQWAPPQATPATFVLADRLAGCRFSYLRAIEPEPEIWVPRWIWPDVWPKAVRIEMLPLEPDPARVPPVSFTGRLRPDRRLNEPFEP